MTAEWSDRANAKSNPSSEVQICIDVAVPTDVPLFTTPAPGLFILSDFVLSGKVKDNSNIAPPEGGK